jgi:hypothetical protein
MVTTWLFKSLLKVPICTQFSTEYLFNGAGGNLWTPADGYLLSRSIRGVILHTVECDDGASVKYNHKHNSMDHINKLHILLSTTLQEHVIFFHSTVLLSGNT